MDVTGVKKNFMKLAVLLILLVLNFVALEAYGHFQQGIIEAAADPAKEGLTHLANDYGLGGIFILFLIGLTALMGVVIYKLSLAFINSNTKHIENETKQTSVLEDLKTTNQEIRGFIMELMKR